jgi:hypothetical protein
MPTTDPNSYPDDYNADNVVGTIVQAVVDRYVPDTYTTAQVANAVAEVLGEGDYAAGEEALWTRLGPIVDTVDDALQRYLSPPTSIA